MCFNETYGRVLVDKHLSYTFPIMHSLKQRDILLPLIFDFPLEYTIRKVQANQESLKLNGMFRLLVYTVDVNLLDETTHTVNTTWNIY